LSKYWIEGERKMKKIISGIAVTLLLVGMLTLVFNIQPVRALKQLRVARTLHPNI
jgi:hypothetical protein